MVAPIGYCCASFAQDRDSRDQIDILIHVFEAERLIELNTCTWLASRGYWASWSSLQPRSTLTGIVTGRSVESTCRTPVVSAAGSVDTWLWYAHNGIRYERLHGGWTIAKNRRNRTPRLDGTEKHNAGRSLKPRHAHQTLSARLPCFGALHRRTPQPPAVSAFGAWSVHARPLAIYRNAGDLQDQSRPCRLPGAFW
jgi:hypothetical protein